MSCSNACVTIMPLADSAKVSMLCRSFCDKSKYCCAEESFGNRSSTMMCNVKAPILGSLTRGCVSAAIKDNVISAVDELYIAKRQPQDAAQCLIDVTVGSNMGALHLVPSSCLAPLTSLLTALSLGVGDHQGYSANGCMYQWQVQGVTQVSPLKF